MERCYLERGRDHDYRALGEACLVGKERVQDVANALDRQADPFFLEAPHSQLSERRSLVAF